jgi:predicted Zn-dependent protease
MAEVILRVAAALFALAVVAALAVQLRAHDQLANAAALATQVHPKPTDVKRQLEDVEAVEDVRPGSQGALAAAALDLRTARYAAAIAAATRATKREPKNFSAWVTLAVARAGAGDAAGRRAAFAKAHLLNPLYPIPR